MLPKVSYQVRLGTVGVKKAERGWSFEARRDGPNVSERFSDQYRTAL